MLGCDELDIFLKAIFRGALKGTIRLQRLAAAKER